MDVMYGNLVELMGEEHVQKTDAAGGGSTDAGDISHIMPTLHANIGGAQGAFHSDKYRLVDKELAYISSAKALVMTAIDLLADGADTGLAIKEDFTPAMTKEQFLKDWGNL